MVDQTTHAAIQQIQARLGRLAEEFPALARSEQWPDILQHLDHLSQTIARQEQQAESSRRFLKTVIEHIPDPIFIKDKNHRLLEMNQANARVIGRPEEELIGQSDYDFFPPDLAEMFHRRDDDVFAANKPLTVEDKTVWADGQEHIAYTRLIPIPDSSGKPAYLLGITQDVTEQKAREEERDRLLAETAALYQGTQAITKALSERQIFDALFEQFHPYDPCEISAFRFNLVDDEPIWAELVAVWHKKNTPSRPAGTRLYLPETAEARLLTTPEPLFIDDIASDGRLSAAERDSLAQTGACAAAILPLTARQQVLGAVMVVFTYPYTFSKNTRRLWLALLDQAGISLAHRQFIQEAVYRTTQMDTAAEVARSASSILNLQELLNSTVALIRDRFNLYYVGAFLVDESGEWAVLRAGTGEAGQVQLNKGHRLKIGGESMIGWAIKNRQARIALDVGKDAVHFQNPDLPDTRSEMALPLIYRNEVIGALTVQSTEQAAFSREDIIFLQSTADQLAIAIENARLYMKTRASEATTRALLNAIPDLIFRLDKNGVYLDVQGSGNVATIIPPEEFVGKTLFDVLPPDLARKRLKYIQQALKTGRPQSFEYELEIDGQKHYFESRIVVCGQDEVLAIIRDITARKQTEQEILRRNEELAAINRVATAVTAELDMEVMLSAVAREMTNIYQARGCGIALLTPNKTELRVVSSYAAATDGPDTRGTVIPVSGNPSSQKVIETGKPLVVSQAQTNPLTAPIHPLMRQLNTHSLMIVPLLARGEVIGTIGIDLDDPDREFSPADVSLAETIAGQIAGAVENAHLFEQIETALQEQKRSQEIQASIYRISEAANTTKNLNEFYRAAHNIIGQLIPAKNLYIALYDEARGLLTFPYWQDEHDPPPEPRLLRRGLTEYVLRTGNPLIASPERLAELKDEIEPTGSPPVEWLGVPLKTQEKTIGVLVVQSYAKGITYGQEAQNILMFVSTQLAMAIERKQAEEALQTSEAKYRELVENANSIIFRMDTEGKVTFFNEFAQKFFGYTEAEIVGRHVVGKIVPETETGGRDLSALIDDLVHHPDRYASNVNENICRDGHRVWVAWANKAIFDDQGRMTEILCVGNDITRLREAEQALRNSEALYASLVESLPQFIFRKDLEGRFVFANQRYCRRIGRSLDEIVGKTDFDLYPAELAEQYRADDRQVISSRQVMEKVEERLLPDGDRQYIRVVKTPSYDAGGQVIGIQGISWDITERVKEQQALAESVSLLQTTLESTADGILVVNREGNIVRYNQKFADMWRIPPHILASGDDRQAIEFVLEQLQDPGQFVAQVQNLYDNPEATSVDILHFKDGRVFERHSHPQQVEGEVIGRVWSFRDVTEQKQAEAALVEERNLLRALMDNLPDYIYVKDAQSRFVVANQPVCRQLGAASVDDIIGKTDFDFSPRELAEQYYADEQALLKSGKPLIGHEEPILDQATGEYRWVLTTKVPFRDSQGQVAGLVGLNRDITSLKQAQQALQDALRRSQSLYTISEALATAADRQQALETVLGEYLRLLNLSRGSISLIDRPSGFNKLEALYLEGQPVHPSYAFPVEEDRVARRLTENPAPLLIEDVHAHPLTKNHPQLHTVRAMLLLPLTVRGQLVGIMSAEATEADRKFSQNDVEIGKTIAEQLAIWLENRHLFETARHRTTLLQTGAEVSGAASSILDVNQLINTSVNLIRDKFDFYYVGLFLVDPAGEWAVLQAGTGEAGRLQVEKGHRLQIGGESMIGWSIAHRQARIALDVGKDAVHFRNPYLPDTHSEMALPLISRDQVIGALTVQSVERGAFSDEDITVLQTMADQLANAIANARLFEHVTRAQQAAEALLQETQALQQLSQSLAGTLNRDEILNLFFRACSTELGFEYVMVSLVDRQNEMVKAVGGMGVTQTHIERACKPLNSNDIMADIIRTGRTEVITEWDPRFDKDLYEAEGHADWVRLFTPITLRHEQIGLVEAGFNRSTGATIQDSQIRLLRAFIDQTALALDNAERYQASRKAARREALIKEITTKVRASTDIDQILQTTVKEIGNAIEGKRAYVHLVAPGNGETGTHT